MRFTTLLFVFLPLLGMAQIQFASASWETAKQRAALEEKLIFLDAYTSWCGPCARMAREVFPNEQLGQFFNRQFINLRIDMESEEGKRLKEQLRIHAYPNLLFANAEGEVLHREAGYQSVEALLELGKQALDPEERYAARWARYQSGERDPEFLFDMAQAAFDARLPEHMEVARAYLDSQEDWNTRRNRKLIFTLVESTQSKMFDFLVNHRPSFEQQFGARTVVDRIQGLIMEEAFAGDRSFAEMDELFERAFPEVADELSARFRMTYYRTAADYPRFAEAAVEYYERFPPDDPGELNNTAWLFFETIEDRKLLKRAVEWAQQSIAMEDRYYNNDTLAALYFKLGKEQKAIRAAQHAIELAKQYGEDYSTTEALLERLRR